MKKCQFWDEDGNSRMILGAESLSVERSDRHSALSRPRSTPSWRRPAASTWPSPPFSPSPPGPPAAARCPPVPGCSFVLARPRYSWYGLDGWYAVIDFKVLWNNGQSVHGRPNSTCYAAQVWEYAVFWTAIAADQTPSWLLWTDRVALIGKNQPEVSGEGTCSPCGMKAGV